MSVDNESSTWYGSVLVVTAPGLDQPELALRHAGPVSQAGNDTTQRPATTTRGTKLYEDPHKAFWRFSLSLPLSEYEAKWEYTIPGFQYANGSQVPSSWAFAVPARSQSMRIMFHSCNGFSVGTDTDSWAGPALWNDVLRVHAQRPFHVMIGGGDQIYNDGIRVDGPLRPWTEIANPHKRHHHNFDCALREECDEY
jgi:hypothetical protein